MTNAPTTVEREDGDEWVEDGFRFKQVFGLAKIVGTPDDYTEVVSDEGEEIEWEKEGIFNGTFLGSKVIPDVESLNGKRDATLLRFADKNGVKRSCWGGYILDEFARTTPDMTPVVIEYAGKKSFGKSGQTMQAFNIFAKGVKKATAANAPTDATAGNGEKVAS